MMPHEKDLGHQSSSISQCSLFTSPDAPTSFGEDNYRKTLGKFLVSDSFEAALGLLIFFYISLVIIDTDAAAKDSVDRGELDPNQRLDAPWVFPVMVVMNVIYVTDMGLRIYAFTPHRFFRDLWNCVDSVIIVLDLLFNIATLLGVASGRPFAFLRMLRFIKVARAYRTLHKFEELHMMMKGLASALRSMFWGLLVTIVVLVGWSILATQVLHPLVQEMEEQGAFPECERCGRAFGSVFQSFLTFSQTIIAGDGWGLVSVPMIEAYPLTGVFFGVVLVSIQWCIMNMILAAVCDAANQARRGTEREMVDLKMKEIEKMKGKLIELCMYLDTDNDGCLTAEEVKTGASTNLEFADTLRMMDIQPEDMDVVFNILDTDGSGDIDYMEFAEQLQKMKEKNHITMLCFIQHYVVEIRKKLQEDMRRLHEDLTATRPRYSHQEQQDHIIRKEVEVQSDGQLATLGQSYSVNHSTQSGPPGATQGNSLQPVQGLNIRSQLEVFQPMPTFDITSQLEDLKQSILSEVHGQHDVHEKTLNAIRQSLRLSCPDEEFDPALVQQSPQSLIGRQARHSPIAPIAAIEVKGDPNSELASSLWPSPKFQCCAVAAATPVILRTPKSTPGRC